MVVQFQTSFIPKKATPPASPALHIKRFGGTMSLFTWVALLLFVLTAALAAGVFFYRGYLVRVITGMDGELAESRKSFEPEFVDVAVRLHKRIEAGRSLLNLHRALSPLFEILEGKTLESVRFQDFAFDANARASTLSMTGQARSFNAVALQSDVFGKERSFKNPVFSNFTLNEQGDVIFNFKTSVAPEMLLYRETVLGAPPPSDGEAGLEFDLGEEGLGE